MIVTQLLGGLGNQLFQYSFARTLAERHGVEVRLDTAALETLPSRRYALSNFKVRGTVLSSAERRALRIPSGHSRLFTSMCRLFGMAPLPVVRERAFSFDPVVLEAPASCYIEGYWQSPKYFARIESLLREELVVRDPLAGRNLEIADKIRHTVSVSLHVRRGDYVANPATNQFHGVCGPEYYESAQRLLRERFAAMELFVFSDDADWVEQNLAFLAPATIVRHNGPDKDYEDLRLLSLCRHHIIANSTFSWWGAWLCNHPDKVVVAPQGWFRESGHSTDDLIPAAWIRL